MSGAAALCVGELLVDFVPVAGSRSTYEAAAGGAPANVAAALAYEGWTTAMIGRRGDDWLGSLITHALTAHGVDTSLIQVDPARATGVAIVAGLSQQPPFVMHRAANDFVEMTRRELRVVQSARLLHVSSLLLRSTAGSHALDLSVRIARQTGALVSTDVNLRPSAWPDDRMMLAAAHRAVEQADVVKATAEELELLGMSESDLRRSGSLWLVTDGKSEAKTIYGDAILRRSIPAVPVVDTTGAGDASLAGLLSTLLSAGVSARPRSDRGERITGLEGVLLERALETAVERGCAAVQRSGGMPLSGRVLGSSENGVPQDGVRSAW